MCLFIVHDDVVGTSCTEADTFATDGLTQSFAGPDTSVQAALIPGDAVTDKLAAVEAVSSSIVVNTAAPVDLTLVVNQAGETPVTVNLTK